MKVKELMTRNAKACTVTTNLAEAAGMMWDTDCGILPVVAEGGKVVGVITDRDICISVAMNNRNPANLAAEDVMSGKVYSVSPEEDVSKALERMQEQKVRRLAVTDSRGYLQGILSLNDIILRAQNGKGKQLQGVTYKDVVDTLKAISTHRSQANVAKA